MRCVITRHGKLSTTRSCPWAGPRAGCAHSPQSETAVGAGRTWGESLGWSDMHAHVAGIGPGRQLPVDHRRRHAFVRTGPAAWAASACVCSCAHSLRLYCVHLMLQLATSAPPARCPLALPAYVSPSLSGPSPASAPSPLTAPPALDPLQVVPPPLCLPLLRLLSLCAPTSPEHPRLPPVWTLPALAHGTASLGGFPLPGSRCP